MRGFSKAIIAGNLTRDPELRTTPNGASVCGFTVAVNRVYRDASGTQREGVSFIDCSAWSKLGEMIAQYAKKGTAVLVCGRLDQRSWEDKIDGKKRSRVEIVVEDFNFTGAPVGSSRPAPSIAYGGAEAFATPEVNASDSDIDIPADIPTDAPADADDKDGIELGEMPF